MKICHFAARLLVVAALSPGCGDDGGPAEGSELGACVDGFCRAPLVCAPEDVCVDPAQLASTGSGATTPSADSGTSAGDSSQDEGTTADTEGGSADEGGADEGGADEGGADEGGADEGGADEGGADEGGADGGDGGSDIPAACVQFGNVYCSCLGDAAAPNCVQGATESCVDVYDLCPSYWTCANTSLGSCDLDDSECHCG